MHGGALKIIIPGAEKPGGGSAKLIARIPRVRNVLRESKFPIFFFWGSMAYYSDQ
jgi:hypothetical protein